MTTFTVHSFKGGSGKTAISINVCALLANQGYNIALLDFDFHGPSLVSLFNFPENPELKQNNYINDYIEENCSIDDILVDFSNKFKTKGKFFIAKASPNPAAIQNMIGKGRRWQMRAMEKILSLKKKLKESYNIDFICFDSSPGLHYSSLNSIVASDLVFLVVKYDISDFEGTLHMLKGIHSALEKKTWLLVNRVPVYNDLEILEAGGYLAIVEDKFKEAIDENFGILGSIPCLCDVGLYLSSTTLSSTRIFAIDQPESPFVKSLDKIVTILSTY
ncbi:MAG: MinD/ParA family ATP-binding protein [Candidatus Hodarchaeales archaeon]|jgi:MinD-like ATPase involved in chromosome partitioning or flagellar assembly